MRRRSIVGPIFVAIFFRLMITLLSAALLQAQEPFDPDEVFRRARELGFSGKHEEARQLCGKILEQYPSYVDVRIFLARLQSWDGDYDHARRTLLDVLSTAPNTQDARSALIDVELWSGNPSRALEYTEAALRAAPSDATLLYKKALAFRGLNREKEAAESLERILDQNPSNHDARSLMDEIKAEAPYKLIVDYGYDRFSAASWHEGSLSLSRETSIGSVAGRFSYANRFSANAYQYEVDAYPHLRQGLYAYVNYGYSPSAIFPQHKGSLELFANPGKGLELSGGVRYLHLSEDVWIYTGSVGKYLGNYFVDVRPFVTPATSGTFLSGTVLLRRYYSDSDSYIGLYAGGGSAPDDLPGTIDFERLNSFKIGVSGSLRVRQSAYWTFRAGWESEQLPSGRHRSRASLSTGFTKRF